MFKTTPDNSSKFCIPADKIIDKGITSIVSADDNKVIYKNTKNLLTIVNSTKFKISNLVKSKKSNLAKSRKLNLEKKLDFTKANFSKTDFLLLKAKNAFIYLQKTFIKTPILYHFELEQNI